ncbi:MAG TPA: GlsB/YeaQ/YmgE family stress response membrane protein [Myxococcaceae bacterium]|nr:GlsB/YeaQ/YmgE family stress response membrane protein [Myxococcaceae bacterium]
MTIETFLLWIAIGGIAGYLASLVAGGGFGLAGDIVIGVVGAFVGGFLFRALGWHAPFAGIAGTITVAFVGAVLLLALLRVVRSGSRRRA